MRSRLLRVLASAAVATTWACSSSVPGPPDAPQLGDSAALPQFTDYPPPGEPFTGTPAPPDFASLPGARMFGTAIRAGAASGPNLANRFTVVSWGCGTECHQFVILETETGRITEGITTRWGVEHRLDSELLIVNPRPDDVPSHIAPAQRTRYYRWTGDRMEIIGEL